MSARAGEAISDAPSGPPLVSLIVIAYCEAARIADCLDAILAQEQAPAFEVIVVDDGSPDPTAEIAEVRAASDGRVCVLRLGSNRGRGAARRAGVATAAGRFIGFVDADITLPPDWLTRCLAALPGHTAAGGIAVPDGEVAVIARLSGAGLRARVGSRPVTGNNVLFEGAVLQAATLTDDRLGEDFRLVSRLEQAGHRFATVAGLIVRHDERKPFLRYLRFMFESGVDATRLLREFRIVRLPDLAATALALSLLPAALAAGAGAPAGLLLPAVVFTGVWVVHALTRFSPTPSPGRFLLAVALDLPAIGAYLAGRLVGIADWALAVLVRTRRDAGSTLP